MSRQFRSESKNYITTYKFGPGINFAYHKRIKTQEEFLLYQKEKGLHIYDENNYMIGKCEKHSKTWTCYVKINDLFPGHENLFDILDDMNKINKYVTENNLKFPTFDSMRQENKQLYYIYTCAKKDYPTIENIHDEIKRVFAEIKNIIKSFPTDKI